MLQEKKNMLEERSSIPRRGEAGPGEEQACSREEKHAPGKIAWQRKIKPGRRKLAREKKSKLQERNSMSRREKTCPEVNGCALRMCHMRQCVSFLEVCVSFPGACFSSPRHAFFPAHAFPLWSMLFRLLGLLLLSWECCSSPRACVSSPGASYVPSPPACFCSPEHACPLLGMLSFCRI